LFHGAVPHGKENEYIRLDVVRAIFPSLQETVFPAWKSNLLIAPDKND